MKMNIISLGDTCCVAWQKPKGEYYPFDWVKIPKFATINQLLKNEFATFFSNLKFVASSTKFPLNSDDSAPFVNWQQQTTHIYSNGDTTFYHDFNQDQGCKQVKEKYQRRIARFYHTIAEGKILFIRHQLNLNSISSNDIQEFTNILDGINCNYRLKIILHNPKNKTVTLMSNDLRVTIINDTTEFKDWTRPTLNWSEIFTETD